VRRRAFVHPKSAAVGLSFMVHSSMTHSRWCWWWRLDRCLQWTEGWRLLPWPHLASCPGRGRILVGRVTVSWDYLDSPKWQNREGQGGLWMFMVCKSVWKNVKDMRQLVCPTVLNSFFGDHRRKSVTERWPFFGFSSLDPVIVRMVCYIMVSNLPGLWWNRQTGQGLSENTIGNP
jgi:hypothetical protein